MRLKAINMPLTEDRVTSDAMLWLIGNLMTVCRVNLWWDFATDVQQIFYLYHSGLLVINDEFAWPRASQTSRSPISSLFLAYLWWAPTRCRDTPYR